MKSLKIISSELVLGALVALLSVLVAMAAYQGGEYGGKESEYNVEGQKQLTDSNGYYLEANQFVIYDFTMYDGYYVNEGKDDAAAEYYRDNFSEALLASMERPDGPFDDAYYEEMHAEASSTYDEALSNFEKAKQAGDRSAKLQLAVLIFAVGLALAAYASLLSMVSQLRLLFGIGSIFGLIFGLFVYIGALL